MSKNEPTTGELLEAAYMVARLAAAHEEMTSDEAKGLVMDAAQAVLSRIVPVECKVVPFVLREIGDE